MDGIHLARLAHELLLGGGHEERLEQESGGSEGGGQFGQHSAVLLLQTDLFQALSKSGAEEILILFLHHSAGKRHLSGVFAKRASSLDKE